MLARSIPKNDCPSWQHLRCASPPAVKPRGTDTTKVVPGSESPVPGTKPKGGEIELWPGHFRDKAGDGLAFGDRSSSLQILRQRWPGDIWVPLGGSRLWGRTDGVWAGWGFRA